MIKVIYYSKKIFQLFNNIKGKTLKIYGSFYSSLNTDIINQKDFQSKRIISIKLKMKNKDGTKMYKKRRKHCVF